MYHNLRTYITLVEFFEHHRTKGFKNTREIFPFTFFFRIYYFLRTELFYFIKHNEL